MDYRKKACCVYVCVFVCTHMWDRQRERGRKRVESAAERQRTSPSPKIRILQQNIVSQISNDNSINQDNVQSDKNRKWPKIYIRLA